MATPACMRASRRAKTACTATLLQPQFTTSASHLAPRSLRHASTSPSTPPSARPPLSPEVRRFLDSALRVNHAGELAATLIYGAQNPMIIRSHPHLRPLVTHMHEQEKGHFEYFDKIMAEHRIRPTAMYPVWQVAATALGWGTGLLGREAAMACTEAVETEIGTHYNNQVRVLLQWLEETERRDGLGEEETRVLEEMKALTLKLKSIRDEELEHLDHAVKHDAKEAKPYELLNSIIRVGCRGAIWVSERV